MREKNENGTLNSYVINGHEIQSNDNYGYKIIAVIHSKDFWTAYMGLTDWSDYAVASGGDTVSYDIARQLFPTIDAMIPNYNN